MTSHRQPPSAFRSLSPLTTSTTSKDTMTTPSTQTDPMSYTSRAAQATPAPTASVADLLEAGEPYVLSFGGQATPWRTSLAELLETDREVAADLIALDEEVSRLLAPVATELLTICPRGLRVLDDDGAAVVPAPSHAGQGDEAAVSVPGILLAQHAVLASLPAAGIEVTGRHRPAGAVGHSQGV
ncbi:hypothetical protein, partial [Actinomyces urogenitalis]